MLNKPKFLSPSVNICGNTTVDLNFDTIPFSCIVDGNEAVVAWQIKISRIEDNAVVFDSGKKELEPPFYPINNRNQNVVFSINLKNHIKSLEPYIKNVSNVYDSTKAYYKLNSEDETYVKWKYTNDTSWNIVWDTLYIANICNSSSAYFWDITLWGESGAQAISAPESFYANSKPATDIYYSYVNSDSTISKPVALVKDTSLSKKKMIFKATYKQEEGISLKRYGWRLTDSITKQVIIDTITQNQIYGIKDDISCECRALINQSSYLLELYIETQNGFGDILNSVKFKVDYPVEDLEADFDISALNCTSGIMLNWGNLRTTEGIVIGGEVSYQDNLPIADYSNSESAIGSTSVNIPEGSSIVFSNTATGRQLDIDEDSYVTLSFQFDKTQDVVLFEMDGVDSASNAIIRRLKYIHSNSSLEYTIYKDGTTLCKEETISNSSGETCWYIVTLYPLMLSDEYYVKFDVFENLLDKALFPSDDLYPSNDTYPIFGKWNKIREE